MSANLENMTPGEILLEDYMKPMGLTQNALARGLGVPPRRINEIIHGKRAITLDTSLRLGRFFGQSAQRADRVRSSQCEATGEAGCPRGSPTTDGGCVVLTTKFFRQMRELLRRVPAFFWLLPWNQHVVARWHRTCHRLLDREAE